MNTRAKIIQSIKIWLVIYPSITLLLFLMGSTLEHFPLLFKTLILTLIMVPWMVFIGLPIVNTLEQKLLNK